MHRFKSSNEGISCATKRPDVDHVRVAILGMHEVRKVKKTRAPFRVGSWAQKKQACRTPSFARQWDERMRGCRAFL